MSDKTLEEKKQKLVDTACQTVKNAIRFLDTEMRIRHRDVGNPLARFSFSSKEIAEKSDGLPIWMVTHALDILKETKEVKPHEPSSLYHFDGIEHEWLGTEI